MGEDCRAAPAVLWLDMAEPSRRSIVREHEFERELLALAGGVAQAADEFILAAEWVLSADPRIGSPLTRGAARAVWFLPMSPVRGKTVSLFYSFDAENVYFLSITAR